MRENHKELIRKGMVFGLVAGSVGAKLYFVNQSVNSFRFLEKLEGAMAADGVWTI